MERTKYERSIVAARTQLGEEIFAIALAQGRAMTPEQALIALCDSFVIRYEPNPLDKHSI